MFWLRVPVHVGDAFLSVFDEGQGYEKTCIYGWMNEIIKPVEQNVFFF
jgi:hypothetical protein